MGVPVADRYAWWRALRGSTLRPTAWHVALGISTYMTKAGDGAWPSMATIAADTGRSRSTVARAVRELVDAGYLSIESGGGRRADGGYVSNRYLATTPSGVTDDTDSASNGVTHDTDNGWSNGSGTVSSDEGAVSSEPGTVSSESSSGVTHDTRTAHELAIHHPKQHAATKSRAAGAADKPSPNGKSEAQGQEPHGARARRLGKRLGEDTKIDRAKAGQMFVMSHSIPAAYEDAFWESFDDVRYWITAEQSTELGVAS